MDPEEFQESSDDELLVQVAQKSQEALAQRLSMEDFHDLSGEDEVDDFEAYKDCRSPDLSEGEPPNEPSVKEKLRETLQTEYDDHMELMEEEVRPLYHRARQLKSKEPVHQYVLTRHASLKAYLQALDSCLSTPDHDESHVSAVLETRGAWKETEAIGRDLPYEDFVDTLVNLDDPSETEDEPTDIDAPENAMPEQPQVKASPAPENLPKKTGRQLVESFLVRKANPPANNEGTDDEYEEDDEYDEDDEFGEDDEWDAAFNEMDLGLDDFDELDDLHVPEVKKAKMAVEDEVDAVKTQRRSAGWKDDVEPKPRKAPKQVALKPPSLQRPGELSEDQVHRLTPKVIIRNRGLVRYRKKSSGSSRFQNRQKYEKKLRKHKTAVQSMREGAADGRYEGERTGINSRVVRTTQYN